jgi:hypothetical protein
MFITNLTELISFFQAEMNASALKIETANYKYVL